MTGVVRLADIDDGACGHVPRANDEASNTRFVDGRGVHRVGDHWPIHCRMPPPPCHDSHQATGSNSCIADGRKVARIGDLLDCGAHNATGSSTCFAGD